MKTEVLSKELTHNHTIPHFDALKIYIHVAVENIVRKGEIACNKPIRLKDENVLINLNPFPNDRFYTLPN